MDGHDRQTSPLHAYPLLDALRERRSRRFGRGMRIEEGPLAYESAHPPEPLTEDEEAALVFAACGVTGPCLADLAYGPGQGGSMLAGLVGRTVGSPDAVQAVTLAVTNDEATYLVRRPQDLPAETVADLVERSRRGDLTGAYRQARVKIADGRAAPPVRPGYNFNINGWSVYAEGGTYFVPLNELTVNLINALLEAFEPEMGLYLIDERNNFQPAGLRRFGRSRGGALYDDPKAGRVANIQGFEMSMAEAVCVEQGMMLQNLGLMTQALGLGGFANYARHEYGWFDALGFRMQDMPASRYAGARPWMTRLLGLTGFDVPYRFPLGLEREGEVLLRPYCPPYFGSMREAVHAFVDFKFGTGGVFREGTAASGWRQPERVAEGIDGPSDAAVEATIAYCEYVYRRYGRFPAYAAPFRTVIGYQATVVDTDFYDRFYRPEALSETQRRRDGAPAEGGMDG